MFRPKNKPYFSTKNTLLCFSAKICRSKHDLLIPFRKCFFFCLTKYNPIQIFRCVFEIIPNCSWRYNISIMSKCKILVDCLSNLVGQNISPDLGQNNGCHYFPPSFIYYSVGWKILFTAAEGVTQQWIGRRAASLPHMLYPRLFFRHFENSVP